MEFNIKEFKISGDESESSPLGFYDFHQSSNNPLFKSDSAHKSTLFTSNSNNEIISNEIENKNINFSKKEDNNNNNNNNKQKIKSHKERIMSILNQEKSKIVRKESILPIKNVETPKEEKKERTDRNGTVINKKNKRKIKVTFIDQINKINKSNKNDKNDKNNKLVTVIKIESFKQYNVIVGMPKEDYYNNKSECKCCLIY